MSSILRKRRRLWDKERRSRRLEKDRPDRCDLLLARAGSITARREMRRGGSSHLKKENRELRQALAEQILEARFSKTIRRGLLSPCRRSQAAVMACRCHALLPEADLPRGGLGAVHTPPYERAEAADKARFR